MKNGIIDIISIIQNFSQVPLKGEELDENTGFYVDTTEARTGNSVISPVKDIFDECTIGNTKFIHLLFGHRGSGKSTEINKLEIKFQEADFVVKKIDSQVEASYNTLNVEYILKLISNALLDICNEKNIKIPQSDNEKLKRIFGTTETIEINKKLNEIGFDVEAKVGFNLLDIIKAFTKLKGQTKDSSEQITTVQDSKINHYTEWRNCINVVIEKIKENNNQKYPIIIFENFDKITPAEKAIEIFETGYLDIRTYIIYTFHISALYSENFKAIEPYVSPHFFPMIDVKTRKGKKNEIGYDTIKKIIAKRTNPDIFEEKAINVLIEKTGGSLTDIFGTIGKALLYTKRQSKNKVGVEEIERALEEEKEFLNRKIVQQDYDDLKKIYENKTKIILNKNEIYRFIESHLVFSYKNNHENWYDLHPLIYDLLKEHGRID